MASIVVVHGIGQQVEGPNTLSSRLFPALRDGMSRAGTDISPDQVSFVSYGELFRPEAEFLAPESYYDDSDVASGYEEDLLIAIWERAASSDQTVVPPNEEVLARTPSVARRALAALSRSQFLAGIAERAFIGDLKQVRRYFHDDKVRADVQRKVTAAIADDTRVIVAHSLGSVVAYEMLFTLPHRPLGALVTLGSPLGLRNLIFDRLRPPPTVSPQNGHLKGTWPPVRMWANVADAGDIVAVVEDLRPLFGDQVRQVRVHNGAKAHDMSPYLTDSLTGQLIMVGLNA